MEEQLTEMVARLRPDATSVQIQGLQPIAGGFSRETFAFEAALDTADGQTVVPMILRKDPPPEIAILETSRADEHHLIEAIRTNTSVPVSASLGAEMDPSVFGTCAMILERAGGNPQTSDLFNDGPDADQVDDVVRHLCEVMVELHETDVATIDPEGTLNDPRGVGIDVSSWDAYMDSTYDYYVRSFDEYCWDPLMIVVLDSSLHLRRHKPRPVELSIVHGDFNPANFLYEDGKVTALIDWENTRVGDPREDLGWMVLMDVLSNTSVMSHPADEGGFLAYYNKLRGTDITPEELGYFTLFGTINIAVPVNAAIRRRLAGEHQEFLHLYMVQSSAPALPAMCQLMGYPGFAP